jgi:hypothetical protein
LRRLLGTSFDNGAVPGGSAKSNGAGAGRGGGAAVAPRRMKKLAAASAAEVGDAGDGGGGTGDEGHAVGIERGETVEAWLAVGGTEDSGRSVTPRTRAIQPVKVEPWDRRSPAWMPALWINVSQ